VRLWCSGCASALAGTPTRPARYCRSWLGVGVGPHRRLMRFGFGGGGKGGAMALAAGVAPVGHVLPALLLHVGCSLGLVGWTLRAGVRAGLDTRAGILLCGRDFGVGYYFAELSAQRLRLCHCNKSQQSTSQPSQRHSSVRKDWGLGWAAPALRALTLLSNSDRIDRPIAAVPLASPRKFGLKVISSLL